MTPDQLLTRMLAFADSSECPKDKRHKVINGAYKTWIDSITEPNPFAYEKVKHEKIEYVNGIPLTGNIKTYGSYKKPKMTAEEWIKRRKDRHYKLLNKKANEKYN